MAIFRRLKNNKTMLLRKATNEVRGEITPTHRVLKVVDRGRAFSRKVSYEYLYALNITQVFTWSLQRHTMLPKPVTY